MNLGNSVKILTFNKYKKIVFINFKTDQFMWNIVLNFQKI